jgi:UDP-N-acetylglucosamine--N-acetylmuramyl-(pentapeptide) pyrophosphoryl-undecaprenol N-acetylglucosamine transferase
VSAPLFLLAAGGTGGHVFPAEALGAELLRRGFRVMLATDVRGAALGLNTPGLHMKVLPSSGIVGRGRLDRLKSAAVLAYGCFRAWKLVRREKPVAVVGFGGYPSVPPLLAGRLAGLPLVVHEQNSVLGRSNRLVARRAAAIATSFPETRGLDSTLVPKCVWVGNPVRAAVAAVGEQLYTPPGEIDGDIRLLVTGGSQGARTFAEVVPKALADLPEDMRARLLVWQQARTDQIADVKAIFEEAGIRAEILPFFGDMDRRLAEAHLCIGRAGASTVAELAAAGRPSLLVPLPNSADDHQAINARYMEEAGAAWVMTQTEFQPAALGRRLYNLFRDGERLAAAAASARRLARADAARRLADLVLNAARLDATETAA